MNMRMHIDNNLMLARRRARRKYCKNACGVKIVKHRFSTKGAEYLHELIIFFPEAQAFFKVLVTQFHSEAPFWA